MAFISINTVTQQSCAVRRTGYKVTLKIITEKASKLSITKGPHSEEL